MSPTHVSARSSKPPVQGTTVAVVDDDPQILEALAECLNMMGLKPRTYASAEALVEETCLSPTGTPAPLAGAILDVNLGGLNGIALAHRLRAAFPNIPLVIITALSPEEMALLGELPPKAVCLRKPFDLGALEDALFGWIH